MSDNRPVARTLMFGDAPTQQPTAFPVPAVHQPGLVYHHAPSVGQVAAVAPAQPTHYAYIQVFSSRTDCL